jgi:catechol 2,3-dioxygenase-like lactoylglutathione lyase family enzyme
MISSLLQIDIISSLFGFVIGFLSFLFTIRWHQHHEKRHKSNSLMSTIERADLLHWNPLIERRGLGDLLIKMNHIAITVSDVGRSLSFYVDILGLQQIRRPSFDRHGAWLTVGNIELHLIKGIPVIPPVDNLQVTHIAIETANVNEVLHKLRELNIEIRQSLSVTNAHKPKSKDKPRIIQYFFNDPDGYYLELCNCDVLTEFSFNKKQIIDDIDYVEGIRNDTVFEIVQAASHWKTKVQKHSIQQLDEILKKTPRATSIDQEKFNNLIKRRFIYGDIIQGFTDEDIKEALLQTNNSVPLTIEILTQKRGENKYFQPDSFLENGKLVEPEPFIMDKNNFNE